VARNRSLDGDVNVAVEILDCAMRLFNERGYAATSLRDLAEATGISSSTLYHHYKNKQQILYTGLCRFMEYFNRTIIPELQNLDDSPTERITHASRLHIELSIERATELRHVRQFKASLTEQQLRHLLDMQWHYQDELRTVIKAGVASGEFAVADLGLTTMAIMDMLNGVRGWYNSGGSMSIDEITEYYAGLVRKTLSRS